jgi:DNA-binding GntR family transcriptional regulator
LTVFSSLASLRTYDIPCAPSCACVPAGELAPGERLNEVALASHHQISPARSISAKQPLRTRAAVVEHQELVEAMQARDVHTATDLMDQHIGHSRDSALTALGLPTETREDA